MKAAGCQPQRVTGSKWALLMHYEGCRLPTTKGYGFKMGPIDALWRLQVANHKGLRVQNGPYWCIMKAAGCQPQRVTGSKWALLMHYEGCRLPTTKGYGFKMGPIDALWRLQVANHKGLRVQNGPHWCLMKAAGCQPQRVTGSKWAPLMSYEGCRLPTYRGLTVQDGPHWCLMKAVGCQPTGGYGVQDGPHWCIMTAVGCQPTGG